MQFTTSRKAPVSGLPGPAFRRARIQHNRAVQVRYKTTDDSSDKQTSYAKNAQTSQIQRVSPSGGAMGPLMDAFSTFRRLHLLSPTVLGGGTWLALQQDAVAQTIGLSEAFSGDTARLAAGVVAVATFGVLRAFSQTIPFSNREHLVLLPESIENLIGQQSFQQVLAQYGRQVAPKNSRDAQLVTRIGQRIVDAVSALPDSVGGYMSHLKDYEWEFVAIQNDTPNAFVVPGGKVVVFTGLLDLLGRDEDAVAVVVGHEASHVLARHTSERIGLRITVVAFAGLATYYILNRGAQQQQQQQQQGRGGYGRGGYGGYSGRGYGRGGYGGYGRGYGGYYPTPFGVNPRVIQGAVSYGAQLLVELPGSRRHEMEADLVGLKLAGLAGYDVSKAPRVWEIMANKGGRAPASWMSTHPDSNNRQALLRHELDLMQQRGLESRDAYTQTFAKTSYFAL